MDKECSYCADNIFGMLYSVGIPGRILYLDEGCKDFLLKNGLIYKGRKPKTQDAMIRFMDGEPEEKIEEPIEKPEEPVEEKVA